MMRLRVGRLSDVVNGVASTKAPNFRARRLHELSIQWPMVMRVGKAWGLNNTSGRTPRAVNGMSSSGRIIPKVPFCE